ncbi:MAG: SpoIIE family protein phosphatase [Opitutaceae bacterium]|nr:SpoIIE family protein phosphatase [Opitutaceae bacterium]
MTLALCQEHPLLRGIPATELESILARCEVLSLPEGFVLLEPGAENHKLFFLLQGELRVLINASDTANAILLQPGEVVGEMSVIEQKPAGARVVTARESTVLAMPETVYWESYCAHPELVRPMLRSLVARMRRTNSTLQEAFVRQMRFEMVQRELESAARIQASILPSAQLLAGCGGLTIQTWFKPLRHVGGDFYDVIPLDAKRTAFAIGDVSGKGMPAALFMIRVLTTLRMILARKPADAEILPTLNKELCESNEEFMFVTLALLIVDTENGSVSYLNAGHPPVMFGDADGEFATWEAPRGSMLGVNLRATFGSDERPFRHGEAVLLYTDGISEAENPKKELYGIPRIMEALNTPAVRLAPAELLEATASALEVFTAGASQSDDITALVFTRGQ